MYLKLDIDGADGKALHPYPWIPPTGNVMYCMPQEGTEAYLYFPEAEEESAYAVSEIHNLSLIHILILCFKFSLKKKEQNDESY